MNSRILDLHEIEDDRGFLVSLESNRNIPFEIKRVYYIYGTNNQPRGFHAHKELKQVLVCVRGSCKVFLDDGNEKKEYQLNQPNQGLFVDKMIWREMYDFSEDCVLLVLASANYDEIDYIRDYNEFKKSVENNIHFSKSFTHSKAIVDSENIGEGTKVWAHTHIFKGAIIGSNCNINEHTLIENDVIIGNNVTVKSGVYIWDGARIEDNVFLGPNVTFTNDNTPRSKRYPAEFEKITIKRNASIGANSTLTPGVTIGEYAMIGAGSVITKNIPKFALAYGNPAEIRGYVCKCGKKLLNYEECKECGMSLEIIGMGLY